MLEGLYAAMGLSQSAGNIVFCLLLNVFFGIVVAGLAHKSEHKSEIAVMIFFLMLFLEVILGWIDWYIAVIPIIITIVFWRLFDKGDGQ